MQFYVHNLSMYTYTYTFEVNYEQNLSRNYFLMSDHTVEFVLFRNIISIRNAYRYPYTTIPNKSSIVIDF